MRRTENPLADRQRALEQDARTSIGRNLDFYNCRRPDSSLDGATPDQAYFTPLPIRMAA
jgi:putative transposase